MLIETEAIGLISPSTLKIWAVIFSAASEAQTYLSVADIPIAVTKRDPFGSLFLQITAPVRASHKKTSGFCPF